MNYCTQPWWKVSIVDLPSFGWIFLPDQFLQILDIEAFALRAKEADNVLDCDFAVIVII